MDRQTLGLNHAVRSAARSHQIPSRGVPPRLDAAHRTFVARIVEADRSPQSMARCDGSVQSDRAGTSGVRHPPVRRHHLPRPQRLGLLAGERPVEGLQKSLIRSKTLRRTRDRSPRGACARHAGRSVVPDEMRIGQEQTHLSVSEGPRGPLVGTVWPEREPAPRPVTARPFSTIPTKFATEVAPRRPSHSLIELASIHERSNPFGPPVTGVFEELHKANIVRPRLAVSPALTHRASHRQEGERADGCRYHDIVGWRQIVARRSNKPSSDKGCKTAE